MHPFNPKGDYAAIVLSNTGQSGIISADLIGDHIRSRPRLASLLFQSAP